MENLTKVPLKKYRIKKWVKHLLAAFSAILFTSIIAINIITDVLLKRGYFAIGGELFLLSAILYVIYLIIMTFFEIYNE